MKKTIIASFLIVLGAVFTFLNIPRISEEVVSFAGTSNFGDITLSGNLTRGGYYATTTSSSTNATLAQSEIRGYSTIVVTGASSTATNTLKLPASSTLAASFPEVALIPNTGDQYSFAIVNATTTGASTITVTTNTGITLSKATSTAIIPVGGTGTVNLIRKANTDVIATLVITN